MSNDKERQTKYSGIGAQVEIKKRDPSARPTTAPGRLMEFTAEANELQNEIDVLKQKLAEAEQGAQTSELQASIDGLLQQKLHAEELYQAERRRLESMIELAEDENEELKLKLEEAGQGGARMFPLNRLHKVEGRQRILTPEEKEELRENLRSNELDTPITLVKRADGDWDIVSGNNRFDIYLELGRIEIEGIEKGYADDVADRQAFFSNLLHPSLTDYEKFCGFKMLMQKYSLTQEEVGKKAGISQSNISRLLSFGNLPLEVLEILNKNPSILGSSAANDFASLTQEGKGDKVISAIKAIAAGELTQSAALSIVKKVEHASKAKPETQHYVIKTGRKKFAEIKGSNAVIRIDFADEEIRKKAEILIYDLMKSISMSE